MILSMTGYGRSEAGTAELTAAAELRGVNARFFEISMKLPRSLSQRENELRDLIRAKVNRGKVSVVVTIEQRSDGEIPIRVNKSAAKAYLKLLTELKKTLKMKDKVTLQDIVRFSDIFEPESEEESSEKEWKTAKAAIEEALVQFNNFRRKEGEELRKDLEQRLQGFLKSLESIERLSKERIPLERDKLQQRISELVQDRSIIDADRLEFELAMLADKLDVTEECVRFRSHSKFFQEAITNSEAAGRKLNFLIQEMNREANTIGSKTNDVEIAHIVVHMKEELEKIREQLQNIE